MQKLSHARERATQADRVVIDEVLGPLYVSLGRYGDVASLFDDVTPADAYDVSRTALRAVCASIDGDLERARELRRSAMERLAESDDTLLRAFTLQRCGLSAYYSADYDEAIEHDLEAAALLASIRAFRGAAAAYSVIYAIHHTVTGNVEAAREYAQRWEVAAKRCHNLSVETMAVVAQYEIAAETSDETALAHFRRRLRHRPLPQQYRERFAHAIAETIPHGWQGDFRAVKANIVVVQTIRTLGASELALSFALRAIAEAACDEPAEARRHARRAIALSTRSVRAGRSAFEMHYRLQARAMAAAACLLIGDSARGRRLFDAKLLDVAFGRTVMGVMEGSPWESSAPAYRGLVRFLAVARSAVLQRDAIVTGLTKSEMLVLRMLNDGLSAPQIARETGRSVHTIRVHTRAIIAKFGVSGRNAALAFARRQRLIP